MPYTTAPKWLFGAFKKADDAWVSRTAISSIVSCASYVEINQAAQQHQETPRDPQQSAP